MSQRTIVSKETFTFLIKVAIIHAYMLYVNTVYELYRFVSLLVLEIDCKVHTTVNIHVCSQHNDKQYNYCVYMNVPTHKTDACTFFYTQQ